MTLAASAPSIDARHRVLPDRAVTSLDDFEARGGGAALRAAVAVERDVVLAELEASGLRGRGGAGFPTAAKWRTIMSFASERIPTNVVINAAEGEPGTFKDRLLLELNPYAVLEGAMIAAHVVGAHTITVATKSTFTQLDRVRRATDELARAAWNPGFTFTVVEGPHEYLFGEETALLEVIDGRPPFPRIAPPWRRGVVEIVDDDEAMSDVAAGSGLAANVELATNDADNAVPPVLVNNVETFANVGPIIANGAGWFRSLGTEQTPGTLLCTVTGAVDRPGVFEVAAGTSLRDVLGMARTIDDDPSMVLLGVSNTVLTAEKLDTPLSHEAFRLLGSGLGSASFIVVDSATNPVAVAAGASRFLAVESCGQCTPCKLDGLEIAGLLGHLCDGDAPEDALEQLDRRLGTVADGARCNLAVQQQTVVGSIRRSFAGAFEARVAPGLEPISPMVVAELVDLDGTTQTVDPRFVDKQPDWTYDDVDSGQAPVDRLSEHRADR